VLPPLRFSLAVTAVTAVTLGLWVQRLAPASSWVMQASAVPVVTAVPVLLLVMVVLAVLVVTAAL
jgi:hypothetical protein